MRRGARELRQQADKSLAIRVCFNIVVNIMNLTIDPVYLVSVTVRTDHKPKFDNTEEGLLKALTYKNDCYSISSIDHPEFDKIRRLLEKEGYLNVQRNSWNGDTVLKLFTFNGKKFKKGERFPCACAMTGHLKYSK